jgi:hypothetical protein
MNKKYYLKFPTYYIAYLKKNAKNLLFIERSFPWE